MSLLLNSETNTNRFPRARPFLAGQERPGQLRLPHSASSAASLPAAPVVTPGREPLWAAVGVSVPPAHQKHTPEVSFHGSGSAWEMGEVCISLREPQSCICQSARSDPSPTSRQIWILFRVPLSHPVSPDGKWSPRLEGDGGGGDLLFTFFFLFSIFLK